jgi:hypothetical protein
MNLPSVNQLENYRILQELLQNCPEDVSDEDKTAFCKLALGVCPPLLDVHDINLVEKLCPQEWRKYCEWEWGTPEELRANKDRELLAQGWERGPDGEMYFPWP